MNGHGNGDHEPQIRRLEPSGAAADQIRQAEDDFRIWHEPDMARRPTWVRFQWKSGS